MAMVWLWIAGSAWGTRSEEIAAVQRKPSPNRDGLPLFQPYMNGSHGPRARLQSHLAGSGSHASYFETTIYNILSKGDKRHKSDTTCSTA